MGYNYGAFIIWHSGNSSTTTASAVDDKKMVTMAITVVADSVVVSKLENTLAVAPFPFQIYVSPPLPPPPPHLIPPLDPLLPQLYPPIKILEQAHNLNKPTRALNC